MERTSIRGPVGSARAWSTPRRPCSRAMARSTGPAAGPIHWQRENAWIASEGKGLTYCQHRARRALCAPADRALPTSDPLPPSNAGATQMHPWQPPAIATSLGVAASCLCLLLSPGPVFAAGAGPACDAEMVSSSQQGERVLSSQQAGSHQRTSLLAELAAIFEERDPVEAFTLYGTTFKKFVIEQLDGEKVVSRKRGFTVDTCVASARQSEETPSFRFLPVGEKVRISENTICKRSEGAELNLTCYGSCQLACEAGLDRWAVANTARTGFQLLDKDRERLLRSCARECTQDCTRPGKAYDFVITYRK